MLWAPSWYRWMPAGTSPMLNSGPRSSRLCGPFCPVPPSQAPDPMATPNEITQPYIATIESDGRRYNVSVRVSFDGIEYVGRLWFADESWDDLGLPDRGAFPGR